MKMASWADYKTWNVNETVLEQRRCENEAINKSHMLMSGAYYSGIMFAEKSNV